MNLSLISNQQTQPSHSIPDSAFTLNHQLVIAHIKRHQFPHQNLELFAQQYQPLTISNFQAVRSRPNFVVRANNRVLYFGEVDQQNQKHGTGILFRANIGIYEGLFANDRKHGAGVEIFLNGAFYEGQFQNGKPEGIGKFQWSNGETYEGQWRAGLKHGSGLWRGAKGDSYQGEWTNGQADGYGVHIWLNGDRYEGQFQNCLKHGQGTERFANGDTYVGEYYAGKPSGYGEYYWINGSNYKGEFLNGLRHGKGTWKRGSGLADTYEGQYVEDMKHGFGIFAWADGNRYEGQFRRDVREGFGVMHWADGSYYKGHWRGGIQDGDGMLVQQQEVIKGVFYGTKLLQVIDYDNASRNSELEKLCKVQTDISTKVDSFTQTARHFQMNTRGFSLNSKQSDRRERLLHIVHKPGKSVSPGTLGTPKQGSAQQRSRRVWLPCGIVSRRRRL